MGTLFGQSGLSRSRRPRSWGRRIATWLAQGIALFLGASLFFVVLYKWVPVPVTPTMIMDPNGFTKNWTRLSQIDRNMVAAVIAGEDSKFCSHNGFDTRAIEQAWERNQRGGRIRGGSTISQQTAKNVFLWQGGGYFRKALEAWFTVLIEQVWGKRRIMEVYLNVAETGIGTYGVEAGAQRYYNHSAARLSPVEAARIAAALPAPKRREVVGVSGFTRRHGNVIARRSSVVRQSDYDACVYD
ncbi:MAG TPA: monofunctional biosynthetic peptidoglycan transglycosylase [Novosphingobium sp.]|nr:monofunctional biosynthetic peptidoglycan transglycosylase [Novosphingobium sp.]